MITANEILQLLESSLAVLGEIPDKGLPDDKKKKNDKKKKKADKE